MLIVRTPVRISFAGGGTDLPSYYEKYGGMVLSTTIDKYFYTVLTEQADGWTQVISSDLRTLESFEHLRGVNLQDPALEIPFAALKYLGCNTGVNLFLASEVLPGTGLGSSAAVCVNVVKTLSVHLKRELSPRDLAEIAFYIVHTILKKPIGKQDEYAAAYGGLNVLEFKPDRVTVKLLSLPPALLRKLENSLLLFFTGSSRNSAEILAAQDQAIKQQESVAIDSLTQLKGLVPRMRDALLQADLNSFGRYLDEGWRIKKQVSNQISNSRLDRLYETALECGALGGKITGAGGGGFLLLFCEPEKQAALRTAMQELGLQEMRFHFDCGGATVVCNDSH